MALKPQFSFSSGELDPTLHDKVTLERFQNALATARNVIVTKKGSLISRFGRFHFKKSKYDDNPVNCYSPPGSSILIEFGLNINSTNPTNKAYIAIYDFNGNELFYVEPVNSADPEANRFRFDAITLNKLHFVTSGEYVYVFPGPGADSLLFRIKITPTYNVRVSNQFLNIPTFPFPLTMATTLGGTGHVIGYALTMVFNGEESLPAIFEGASSIKKPINPNEQNVLIATLFPTADTDFLNSIDEVRFYERPQEGSAFGFLGRTTNVYIDSGAVKCKFTDIGALADFGQGLQSLVSRERLSDEKTFGNLRVATGTIYQQRLVLANFIDYNKEAILVSRPGFQNNFYRDFPYSLDSALNMKVGAEGTAEVIKVIESDGLVVFTTAGVFVSVGVLSINNLALIKRGDWIIDDNVPPLVIPGGLFFVDKTTNSVRQLIFSQELSSFVTSDQSIFSDHLFNFRTITSWAYQEGVLPMIIVTFSDGTFATFTYDFEHQMKAWTRHDSKYFVEKVVGTRLADTTVFVINKNGTRHFEMTIPREIPASVYASNPEANKLAYSAFMDSLKIKVDVLNAGLVGTDKLILTPITPGEWGGNLTLTCGTSALFTDPGQGAIGTVFRWFYPVGKNRWTMTFTVVSRTNDNSVVVAPSEVFASAYANGVKLYKTHNVVTGLEYLEGEEVSVIADGGVVSSPFNDNDMTKMTSLVVTGGQITLPNDYRSAITIVGRPIVADIKTLNMSTIEQSPVVVESLTVNKLYARLYESKGIFIDNEFPENKIHEVDGTSVKGMQNIYDIPVQDNVPFVGNKPGNPISERRELTVPGTYRNQGQIAMRQVDPNHFEILSIIADVEILGRGR